MSKNIYIDAYNDINYSRQCIPFIVLVRSFDAYKYIPETDNYKCYFAENRYLPAIPTLKIGQSKGALRENVPFQLMRALVN